MTIVLYVKHQDTEAQFLDVYNIHLQVNVNPAYQSQELAYCLNKVGVKALVMADKFKTQNYYHLLVNQCHSLPSSKPGNIRDDQLVTSKK